MCKPWSPGKGWSIPDYSDETDHNKGLINKALCHFFTVPTLLRPKVSSGAVDVQSHILVPPRQARDDIRNLMASGYKLTWISSYRVGLSKSPYFDFVASNNSAIGYDCICGCMV